MQNLQQFGANSDFIESIQTPNGIKAFLSLSPLNVAFHAGDSTKTPQNRAKLIEPFKIEQLAYLNQVHGNEILKADNGGILGDGDGLIITKKGIVGLIMVADCNAILLFDSVKKILILLHAGRVGIEKGIISKAFNILKMQFNSNISDIFAYVSPSIRSCCYEVKNNVLNNDILIKNAIRKESGIYLDLIACIKYEFKQVKCENYSISPYCTNCCDRYFSYRRDSHCGRFGLFATLV